MQMVCLLRMKQYNKHINGRLFTNLKIGTSALIQFRVACVRVTGDALGAIVLNIVYAIDAKQSAKEIEYNFESHFKSCVIKSRTHAQPQRPNWIVRGGKWAVRTRHRIMHSAMFRNEKANSQFPVITSLPEYCAFQQSSA